MSQLTVSICPFDWQDGQNHALQGGQVLAVVEHRFAYGFFNPEGQLTNAFIARVTHGETIVSLLTTYSDEMAYLLQVVIDYLDDADGYNVYANQNQPAGMTVSDHAHLHVLRRHNGEFASGMGLGKLVTEYNHARRGLAQLCT
jgi:hypothetical protein